MEEKERYEQICKPMIDAQGVMINNGFTDIRAALARLESSQRDMHNAIFVGNGDPSIKVQLSRGAQRMDHIELETARAHERLTVGHKWIAWVGGSILVGVSIAAIVKVAIT